MGAIASLLRRRKRAGLLTKAQSADDPQKLVSSLSWADFELLVGEAYRKQGYIVTETGGGGPDGGVDLILTNATGKTFVQCKRWKSNSVGLPVVRELLGSMTALGSGRGIVVTAGRFTKDANEFANKHNIELVDGPKLVKLIGPIAPITPSRASATPTPRVPLCPTCSSTMVTRVGRQGANKGTSFWGCTSYPKCRGTRQLDG